MKTAATTIIIIFSIALLAGCYYFDLRPIIKGGWNIEKIEPDIIPLVQVIDAVSEKEIEDAQSYKDVIKTNLMLNYVIDCESSGRHEGIWGRDGEYGILQYKHETWSYLSKKYNYEGDWKNQDDQIELFLIVSDEDKEIHWTCYREWLKE